VAKMSNGLVFPIQTFASLTSHFGLSVIINQKHRTSKILLLKLWRWERIA